MQYRIGRGQNGGKKGAYVSFFLSDRLSMHQKPLILLGSILPQLKINAFYKPTSIDTEMIVA